MPAVSSHNRLWAGIDELARRNGLSASGLAKAAGLDPTTFNKSKRVTPQGRPRWPGTESLWRVMRATGTSLDEIAAIIAGKQRSQSSRPTPLIGLKQAARDGYFNASGFPTLDKWDEVTFPDVNDENAYALAISGNGMAPLYRDGDIIIVSPAASIRRGDRVVVKSTSGEIIATVLARRTSKAIELQSLNPAREPQILAPQEVLWMARIIWASQ